MMRCCGGRWLQRTTVQRGNNLVIYHYCEQCGFIVGEGEEE